MSQQQVHVVWIKTGTFQTPQGRSYTGTASTTSEVPAFDCNAGEALGYWLRIAYSGPTTARPTYPTLDATGQPGTYAPPAQAEFYDTSLSMLIKFDGTAWRNPATGAVV